MKVTRTRSELLEALIGVPKEQIGFVPTMGALHEGHMSLVRAAKEAGHGKVESKGKGDGEMACDDHTRPKKNFVVVSVFVNPTQFNDPADLKSYPRTPERDLAMLEAEGVDVVFMPSVEEIYPAPDTRVWDFGKLDKVMEGATRPGHFVGVAQVVSRLFELVRPARAFFGRKDFQQMAIVREMVRQARQAGESWADVRIVDCPIVRERDGLALSSRNVLLTPEHRVAAPDIHRALELGAEKAGILSENELRAMVTAEVERSGLLKVIYFDFMDGQACIAVQAGNVRLIDNYDHRGN